jgi:hypothetical protein
LEPPTGHGFLASLARRPLGTVTYSASDLGVASLAAVVVAAWAAAAGDALSFRAFIACEAAFLSFYAAGSLFTAWGRLAAGALFDLPLRLLVGYLAVNTALLLLAWLSPLSIVANFVVVAAVVAALFLGSRPVRQRRPEHLAGLLVVGLSLAAATLWCQDSLRPTHIEGNTVLFKPWIDGFYHAVHLRIFGTAHGASTIEDFRMAGVPARLYHYAAYMTPAFIQAASGLRSYTTFAGILSPLGVMFTGLGAYALFGSFWGPWPGLASAAALLLLPDGAQQGLQNKFMSYHWLTQISPTASYGLALVALAWLFVLLGSRQSNRVQVLAGWAIAGVLAVYKLHFAVASALLLLLIPALFFRGGLGAGRRALWVIGGAAAYVVALVLIQRIPGVPVIRFDGSSVRAIFTLIESFAPRGPLRDFLDGHLGTEHSRGSNLAVGVPYLLLSILGLFAPLLLVLAVRLRNRTTPLLLAFPLLIVANFLAMFLGLALDYRSSTPDELSHRPLMIVYFVVVAWVGGATGLAWVESRRLARAARLGRAAQLGLTAAVALLLVPAFLGAGVQQQWAMPLFSPVRVPLGLVQAAEYMRDHGDPRDVFQASQFDRTALVEALSERRSYASRSLTIISHNGARLEQRFAAIGRFMDLRERVPVLATAQRLGLQWFLLEPGDQVAWPDELTARPAFEIAGYRLYRF